MRHGKTLLYTLLIAVVLVLGGMGAATAGQAPTDQAIGACDGDKDKDEG